MDIKETIVLNFDVCKDKYKDLRENRDSYSSMVNIEDIIKERLSEDESYSISITIERK